VLKYIGPVCIPSNHDIKLQGIGVCRVISVLLIIVRGRTLRDAIAKERGMPAFAGGVKG